MLDQIASATVAHSNSWRCRRLTILSIVNNAQRRKPRPHPRHGLTRKINNMADTTKEATFKSVQIDALVRATSLSEKPPPAAPLLFFSRHIWKGSCMDRRLTVDNRWLSSSLLPAESLSLA